MCTRPRGCRRGVKPRGKAAALAAPARAIRNADDGVAPGARLPRGVWPQVPGSRCCGVMSLNAQKVTIRWGRSVSERRCSTVGKPELR